MNASNKGPTSGAGSRTISQVLVSVTLPHADNVPRTQAAVIDALAARLFAGRPFAAQFKDGAQISVALSGRRMREVHKQLAPVVVTAAVRIARESSSDEGEKA